MDNNTKKTEEPSARAIRTEVLIAGIGIVLVLGIIKHVGAAIPFINEYAFTIAIAVQLFVPLYLVGRRGISNTSLGLHKKTWKRDLKALLLLAVLTTIPFLIGHHYWQTEVWGRVFKPGLPPNVIELVFAQFIIVALAEELFFRGYLQERMQRIWPAKRQLFGAPFGLAIIVTATSFAFGHFIGEYRFERLGPFFPALLFGLLRARTGSILGAIGYHGFCNVLADFANACYSRPI